MAQVRNSDSCYKAMQALAFLLTLLLPVILVYFIRNDSKTDSSQPASAKKKKKSKKKATKRLDSTPQSTSTVKSNEADRESETPIEKPQHKDFTQPDTDDKAPPVTLEETTDKPETFVEVKRKKEVDDSQVSRMTIDEDLDGTARYSRVMRIKTDEPVSRPGLEPLEPGWNRAASKRNVSLLVIYVDVLALTHCFLNSTKRISRWRKCQFLRSPHQKTERKYGESSKEEGRKGGSTS
jgi:hypothetical protein